MPLDLTPDEQGELDRLEAVIRENKGSEEQELALGHALLIIREKRLYRVKHRSVEDYAINVHGISRRQLNRMAEWALVDRLHDPKLCPVGPGDLVKPLLSRRAARPLHKLRDDPVRLARAYQIAAQKPRDTRGHVSTKEIENAVEEMREEIDEENRKTQTVKHDLRFKENFITRDIRLDVPEIPKGKVDMVICSPPYAIGTTYGTGKNAWNDMMDKTEYKQFLLDCFRPVAKWLNPKGGRLCVNLCETYGDKKTEYIRSNYRIVLEVMEELGLMYYQHIVWDRGCLSAAQELTWGSYPDIGKSGCSKPNARRQTEFILVFSKGSFDKQNASKDLEDIKGLDFEKWALDIWKVTPDVQSKKWNHPCRFPQEIPRRLMQFFGQKNDLVVDCFGGSGTTALVAHQLGRRFFSVDRNPDYTDDARQRLLDYTDGKKPKRGKRT